jgi:type IV pilus assembly protein PilA
MRRDRTRGFTIIELLIVVTIIGIISAMAIPAYMGYVTRAKVAEAAEMVGPFKTAVTDRFLQNGVFPADNAAAGFDAPAAEKGQYVKSVQVAGGVIVLTFGDPALLDRTITYTPVAAGAAITWTCTSTLPPHLVPKDCR